MSDPYSRLYHRFPTEFPAIWADDKAFAAWTRLLILADASWPLRPPLPRSIRPKVLSLLATAGLLVVDGDQYTVRGLDAERGRRRDAARDAAAKRWQSGGMSNSNAEAHASALPSTRRDETSTSKETKETPPPPAERGRRANQTNPRATAGNPRTNGVNLRANGDSPRQKRAAEKRGPTKLHDILTRSNKEAHD